MNAISPLPVTAPAPQPARLRYTAAALTGLFGAVASIAIFLMIGLWKYQVSESSFENDARDRVRIMSNDFKDSSDLLYTLRAYVASADTSVSRGEFMRFSERLHQSVDSLRNTGWAPRIPLAMRADFERAVQQSGIPNFQILERDSAGKAVPAGERPEYFPILYSEGDQDPARFVGIDVAFEPVRRSAIHRTIETGKPAATSPVKLVIAGGPRGGLMSFLALPSQDARGAPVTHGVVFGTFDIATMIRNVLTNKAKLKNLNIYFFEPGAAPDDLPNYAHEVRMSNGPGMTQASLLPHTHWTGTVWIMDQEWTAILVPAVALQLISWNWDAVMPPVIGLIMTAMIVAHMLLSLRRTAELEALTISLNQTTEDLRQNMAKVTHMARHDLLTGLPNRALFTEHLEEAVALLGRKRPFCLLFLDLDKFKAVNDTLGHPAGDQLLRSASERMRGCLRETDMVARLGGDEFVIIVRDTATPADLAKRLIDVVSKPYELGGRIVCIGVSIGIAVAPNDGTNPEVLQMHADRALYAAKHAGRSTACFFAPQLVAPIEA